MRILVNIGRRYVRRVADSVAQRERRVNTQMINVVGLLGQDSARLIESPRAKAVNARAVFLANPRYRTFEKPDSVFTT